jgi:hypothetical protein
MRIIAALAQRTPELEAPSEPPGAHRAPQGRGEVGNAPVVKRLR